MVSRIQQLGARILPRGWGDWLRQIVLFCGAYYVYRIVRGIVDDRVATAFANAREIVSIERGLHLFVEPDIQRFARAHEWLIDASSWMYVNSHFVVTTVTLAWIYLRRNERFYFVRNMFMVAMGLALVGYTVFPTAPPRFFPEWGFQDSVSNFVGVTHESGINALFNPYAAVPSMHVCFALMIGIPLSRLVRNRVGRAFWRVYPLLVVFVIVATGNHFLSDAFLGACTAALAAYAASWLARARPAAWAFSRQSAAA